MERDGTGQLSTIYTYGNQRINSESYNNLSGLYAYDGRGSVSAVIGSYGDFRASYWYDGLGNVKSQIHGYGAFGSGKKYYGYNAEQYSPITGNQNLRNRQLNIRRQRFLTEDTYLGNKTDTLSINRYIYGNGNPLKYKDPSGNFIISGTALLIAGAVSLGAGVIAGVATGVTTGDWEKGLKTGLVTAGATAVGIAAGAAAVAGATALGASALVTGVVGGAVGNGVRSVARNTLGNVALGEKNSLGKIGKDFALESLTGAIGGAGGTIVRGLTSTGPKAVVQGAVSAISTGARDVAENAFFGGNKSSTDIWANMGISFVTSAGISYLGDTLISKMNAAKANSGVQACKKAEVDYSASSSNNEHYLHRPYIRKGTIDAINANTTYNENGQMWDDISKMYVDPNNVELGHRPDYEFWRMRDLAESQNWTQAEFNDFMNDPSEYAWQDIHSNRSHVFETPR